MIIGAKYGLFSSAHDRVIRLARFDKYFLVKRLIVGISMRDPMEVIEEDIEYNMQRL